MTEWHARGTSKTAVTETLDKLDFTEVQAIVDKYWKFVVRCCCSAPASGQMTELQATLRFGYHGLQYGFSELISKMPCPYFR